MKKNLLRNQRGQAVVEYILMLGIVLALMSSLAFTFNRWIKYLWQVIACEVSAACPDCPPDPNVRNKISKGCK